VVPFFRFVPEPVRVRSEPGWPHVRGYELLSVIGSGGMGIVYKARHRALQRTVAIKTLRGTAVADPEFRDRFRAEAEAVARLQHPNIIQVFEIGSVEALAGELHPSPFISLEFVDGGSLAGRAATPQAPRDAARMVEKLARGVQAAHRLGIVHRDLKPANVLLTAAGEPKVADFGLAKQLGAERDSHGHFVTQAGVVLGTPEYMAPEQVAGATPAPAIDIYALGVILYELLTARVPFRGATPEETMYLVRHQEPVSPRRLQPRLPRDLETICLKCLQKAPGKRYESAEALADDLARWADGLPIRAQPVGPVERTARWAQRNPAVATLSAAVVLVALAGLTGVVWKWREAQTHADAAEAAAAEARDHARAERWERYRANSVAASSALQVHNVDAARRALEDAPQEFRNWEWHHFHTQIDAAQHVLRWEGVVGTGAAITPDGRMAVGFALDGQVRVWDTVRRKEVRTFRNARLPLPELLLSPDGKTFAYATRENAIVLADPVTDRARAVLRGHSRPVVSLRFSPDATRLASGSEDGTLRVWDVQSGRQLHSFGSYGGTVVILDFSADGRRLASHQLHDQAIEVWDVEAERRMASYEHGKGLTGACFSPRADRLVSVERYPSNVLWLWNLATGGAPIEMRGHTNQVTWLTFNSDGARVATCGRDSTVRLWDGVTGACLATLEGQHGWVTSARFSPDSKRVVSASMNHTVRIWDADNGKPLAILDGHTDEVCDAAYLPDGRAIVSAARDGSVRIWDAETAERDHTLCGHTNFVYDVAFHPDGERVASAAWDGTVRLWQAANGRQTALLDHGEKTVVTGVAFHPAGRLLATIARDEKVRLWDVNMGQQVHAWSLRTDSWRVTRLAFSPKGEWLAAGDRDGAVHLWDVERRAEAAVLRGHRDVVRAVAFSPDSRWLASASHNDEHAIRIWDVAGRKEVRVLEGHPFCINALAWSGDGKLLASGSSDGTVRLWDAATWREAAVLKHGTNVYGVTFTPDHARLASACADNTIRLWAVGTYQEVAELHGHRDYVHAVAFSPDGTRLASASGDFTVRLWDTVQPHERAGARK
jgi:WD40 repeat protein/tRNA A-37 threonylcarbamoyl transferase component Bud32